MGAKRRQSIKKQAYQAWCPDIEPDYWYGGKTLTDVYDRSCYEEGWAKGQEEYDSELRRQERELDNDRH